MKKEKKGMQEMIQELYEKSEENDNLKKKFKMPLGVRLGKRKSKKKNYVIVQSIKTNGAVDFKVQKIEDDTIKIGETFHDSSAEHILRYKRYPLVIVPEWNMRPFSPREDFREGEKRGTLVAAEKLILTKMKNEAVKGKFQMNFKVILLLLVLGAAALYGLNYMGVL
jgi:hypothetical protein